MKKLNIVHWVLMFVSVVVFSTAIQNCTGGDKKPETKLVTPAADTTKIIDTTIIEPGDAPIVDNTLTRGKPDKLKKEKISCAFGFKKFNNRKRPIEEAKGGVKGKPPRPGTEPPPPPPPGESNNIIFLNYFGKTISNTLWNVSGTFTVQDAGLAQEEIDFITTQVKAHFPEYNVNITLDKSVYDAAAFGHKVEVVVTEDWSWYGAQAGGVAYLNSFFWTDGSPAFVFSLLLNYNGHHIAEAIAHEAGHTLGLRHQSDCTNGVVTNQYSLGKTMGVSYYVPIGAWVTGTSSVSCIIQDDKQKLTTAVGIK